MKTSTSGRRANATDVWAATVRSTNVDASPATSSDDIWPRALKNRSTSTRTPVKLPSTDSNLPHPDFLRPRKSRFTIWWSSTASAGFSNRICTRRAWWPRWAESRCDLILRDPKQIQISTSDPLWWIRKRRWAGNQSSIKENRKSERTLRANRVVVEVFFRRGTISEEDRRAARIDPSRRIERIWTWRSRRKIKNGWRRPKWTATRRRTTPPTRAKRAPLANWHELFYRTR